MSKSILDMITDKEFRKIVIDALSNGIGDKKQHLIDILEYVVDQKLHLFENKDFEGYMYDDEDLMIDLILPCVRRIWSEVFMNPPTLFKDKRLEYFQLLFDVDEFIEYLEVIVPKMKKSLELLENLDRTNKTLELIVDNYVGYLVERTRGREDIVADIRDLKIKKTLKK
jgi:hypothetical protein